MKKILLIVLLFWSGVILAQPSWTVVTYTNSTTAYGIVTINGNPAEAGDYVGAFVGNECRASQQVIINSGIAYANLQIQGESAETVSFKVWDASASKELTVNMTTQSAPGSTIGSPPNYLQIRATAPTITVAPENQDVGYLSGTINFAITSNSNWTATSNAAWCTVPVSGSGSGTLTATFTENPSSTVSRTATITITVDGVAPVEIRVTQAKNACALGVSPSNQNVTSMSGTIPFALTTECAWTASSNATWCTVPASGSGSGTLTATFSENPSSTVSRTATIAITVDGVAPVEVTVNQAKKACALGVTPSNQDVTSMSGTIPFVLTSECAWTASSNATWCTIPASGLGSGTLTATFSENPSSTVSRTATIAITVDGVAPVEVTVTQAKKACTLGVIPSNQDVTSMSGTIPFVLTSECAWTASSDAAWCTVPASGSGSGTLTATFEANTTSSSRVATITVTVEGIEPITVTVVQETCTLAVNPLSHTFKYQGERLSSAITANAYWTVATSDAWISISSTSGVGVDTLDITVQPNTGEVRSGSVTVSSCSSTKTITVNQEAWGCSLAVSPSELTYTESSGTKRVAVSSNTDWVVSNDADWITVSKSNGSNSGSFTITVDENTGKSRSGSVTVSGCSTKKSIHINQYSGFKLEDFQVNLQDTIMENDTLDFECIATYSDGSIDSVLSGIVWEIGCDLPIEIDTASAKVIVGEVAGTDSCQLIATYHNFSDTVSFVLKDITVGIAQGFKNDFSINLYPNPSKGHVNLRIDGVLASKIELVVYNLSGEQVFYQTICPVDEISIDLSHEVSGIYFVKIIADDREMVKKLILKKN